MSYVEMEDGIQYRPLFSIYVRQMFEIFDDEETNGRAYMCFSDLPSGPCPSWEDEFTANSRVTWRLARSELRSFELPEDHPWEIL